MKRTHLIIYSFLFVALLHVSCRKNGGASQKMPAAAVARRGRLTCKDHYRGELPVTRLRIIDHLRNFKPEPEPVSKGNFILVDQGIETIFPYKNKLFIGGKNGMLRLSLDDPAAPRKEGRLCMSVRATRLCPTILSPT